MEGIGYNVELERRLAAVRDQATLLAAAREGVAAKARDARQAVQRAELRRAAAERANATDRRAQERLEKTCERTRELQSALEQAHRAHATAVLRRQLRPGMPCPVCEGAVAQLPAPIELPDLRRAEDNLVKAREQETRSRAVANHRREAAARAATVAQEAQRAARKIIHQLQHARGKLVKAESELDAEIGRSVANESGAPIEERVINAITRVAELKKGL